MINKLKKLLYFPLAYYFRFFAQIQLRIWKPIIIVVTGSSGKTTLLHLIESQIQDKARYSHLANSSFGIPFDILGLKRVNLTLDEWPRLFLSAPFNAFKKPYKEKLYVVEADCDRPYEGKFLASFLKPNVTLWTNVGRTHTVNFDKLVAPNNRHSGKPKAHPESPNGKSDSGQARMTSLQFNSVEQAISYEFGYFLEETKSLAIVNGDSKLIKNQLNRSRTKVEKVTKKELEAYNIFKDHTDFKINGKTYSINAPLPKEASLSIQMTLHLLDYLKIKPDPSFSKFSLPPGRCSTFKGIKNTTIIDSSYNATPDGVKSILGMFNQYPSDKKWLVVGDMIELGNEEKEGHEKLAEIIASMKLEKIILVGPRLAKYAYLKLKDNKAYTYSSSEVSDSERSREALSENSSRLAPLARTITSHTSSKSVKTFLMPKNALDYLLSNLKGSLPAGRQGEVMLFKGARFLEGIIEHLLLDKNDVKKLCRREKIWQIRRKKWAL